MLLSDRATLVLQETAEFQERYAQTVVYRMMYLLDRAEKGSLTEGDMKRGKLAEAMAQLDQEEDVNKVLKFFSYEHFYVMYCKACPCPIDGAAFRLHWVAFVGQVHVHFAMPHPTNAPHK
jgi:hypothetical protein